MLVSVIILNWNGRHFLDDCLGSLSRQTFTGFETVVVDNGSTDGSVEYLRKEFPWVKLVALPENSGFAGGNNRGFAEAKGEFIVTLNNDTKCHPSFLEEILKPALSDPVVGIVAAKMLNFFQTGRLDSIGIRTTIAGLGVNVGVGETDAGQYDGPTLIFGACAGAALYRRKMLEETRFFDEDFFAYYEDLDLAWRGRLAGWKATTAPSAVVYHVHSATSGRMSAFTVFHVHRNKWYVLIKNWPASLLFRNGLRIILHDVAAILLAALRGRLWAALRARAHVLGELPVLLRKRREISRLRRVGGEEIRAMVSKQPSPLKTFIRKMGSGV